MIKGIIYNSEIEAKNWDWYHNKLSDNVTSHKYATRLLKSTHTYTKTEYAELMNIPETIYTDDGDITNPAYTSLNSSYTLNKCALIVSDQLGNVDHDLIIYDDNGEFVKHGCRHCGEEVEVVEITESMMLQETEV